MDSNDLSYSFFDGFKILKIKLFPDATEPQYFPILRMENDPVFKNNVLMVDTNDILQEFEYQIIAHKDTDGLLGRGMKKIKPENLILTEDSYPLTE